MSECLVVECADDLMEVAGDSDIKGGPLLDGEMPSGRGGPNCSRQRPSRVELEQRVPLRTLVALLTNPETGPFPLGVTPKQLYAQVVKMPDNQRPTKSKNHLQVLLFREVNSGAIVRVKTGRYTTPEHVNKVNETQSERRKTIAQEIAQPKDSPAENSRRPRRKIIQKTHGPDFVNPEVRGSGLVSPPDSATSTSAAESPTANGRRVQEQNQKGEKKSEKEACEYCLQKRRKNEANRWENVLVCKECKARAHATCMGYTLSQSETARRRGWTCIDCKCCAKCMSQDDIDDIIFCVQCSVGYHPRCHVPAIQPKQKDRWMCPKCTETKKTQAAKRQANQAKSPVAQQREDIDYKALCNALLQPCMRLNDHLLDGYAMHSSQAMIIDQLTYSQRDVYSAAVEDVQQWSAENVRAFVEQIGFGFVAGKFQEQEIDGPSLLLLRLPDLRSAFHLRLGESLKLYHRLLKLQNAVANMHASKLMAPPPLQINS